MKEGQAKGRAAMKMYLFDPESSVYLGEDFADEAPMGRGSCVMPPDATTIAPPSVERCQRLVINAAEQRWNIRQRPENKGMMVIKRPSLLLLLLTLFFLPATLHAVTYPFPENEPAYLTDETVKKIGTKVYLFHGGTEEVKSTIHANDILTVYREYPPDFSLKIREVGKVKVLSPLGDYYFDGEVTGGEVKAGDLAKKGTVTCYIIAFKKNGHQQ
jgi:hypothetical protein